MKMSYDDFIEKYKPRTSPEGNFLWETHGEEYEEVRRTNPSHIWTVLDGDIIVAGAHYVNRSNYILTEEIWEDEDITVPLYDHYVVLMTDVDYRWTVEVLAGDEQHARQLAQMEHPSATVKEVHGPYWEAG